jgi:hypothetical protein
VTTANIDDGVLATVGCEGGARSSSQGHGGQKFHEFHVISFESDGVTPIWKLELVKAPFPMEFATSVSWSMLDAATPALVVVTPMNCPVLVDIAMDGLPVKVGFPAGRSGLVVQNLKMWNKHRRGSVNCFVGRPGVAVRRGHSSEDSNGQSGDRCGNFETFGAWMHD